MDKLQFLVLIRIKLNQLCSYDHELTNKAYLSAITVAYIYQSFAYKTAAKIDWHRYGTKLRHCHAMYKLLDGLNDVTKITQ